MLTPRALEKDFVKWDNPDQLEMFVPVGEIVYGEFEGVPAVYEAVRGERICVGMQLKEVLETEQGKRAFAHLCDFPEDSWDEGSVTRVSRAMATLIHNNSSLTKLKEELAAYSEEAQDLHPIRLAYIGAIHSKHRKMLGRLLMELDLAKLHILAFTASPKIAFFKPYLSRLTADQLALLFDLSLEKMEGLGGLRELVKLSPEELYELRSEIYVLRPNF